MGRSIMENARSLKPDGFFWLLIGIFLLRGMAIQCLYPPLEGPDEYQHIAVIHYLVENRVLPVYGQSKVPVSLYDDIVANPHPNHSADQTRRIGAQSYETFYSGKPLRTSDAPIKLYQAQHPPLYYIIMAPLYSWSRSVLDFRSTVYLLRFVNLIAAAFAVVFLLYPLRHSVADERLYRIFALTVAASPMYMIHISRVTNDAFALFFAGITLLLVMRIIASSRPYMLAGSAGLVAGISVMFKLTGLVLLPAVLVYCAILAIASRISLRRCCLCCCAFVAGYLLASFPYHAWVQAQFGTFLFDQASNLCRSSGLTMLDVLSGMRLEHAGSVFAKGLFLDNLWTSGWSFLGVPRSFKLAYGVLMLLAAGGSFAWLLASLRNENKRHIRDWCLLILCALLACATAGAFYLFALKHLAAYNFTTIPSYYFMIAYPALLSCVFVAALGYGRRTASAIAFLLLVLFICTELYGLCGVALPYWAQSQDLSVIFSRLSSLHPVFPAPAYFIILYLLALLLLFVCVRRIFTAR
jgi:hypothetical protein